MFRLFKRSVEKALRKARAANLRAATAALKKLVAPAAKPARKRRTGAKPPKPAAAKPAAAKPKPRASAAGARPLEGLGAAVRRIKAAGLPAQPSPARVTLVLARGASFEALHYASAHGARSYRLYTPAAVRGAAQPAALAPLVVMLHGCTQTPEDFATGTGMNALAEAFGFLIAYPEQPVGANANRCWNWFNRADQARGAGEPAVIAGIARAILRERRADPARVYVAGLSAGGAAATIAANAYPDIFAAAGVHSGLAVGAAHNAASAFLAMRRGSVGFLQKVAVPTIVFHGDADKVVHPRNGRFVAMRSAEAFPMLAATQINGRSVGGRDFIRTVHSAPDGKPFCEHWVVAGAGHAWSGGDPAGSYSDPAGPDASREMVRFFLAHRASQAQRSLAASTAR